MAAASTPSSSKRKTTSRSSNGSSQKSGSGSTKSRSGSTKSRSGSTRARSSASRSGSAGASTRSASPPASSNGSSKAVVITGVATAAAGVVGGVILGKRLTERPRHVLGVRVPGTGAGMSDLVKQVKRSGKHLKTAGKQIADLTDEVRAAREKAEDIGRAIS
jgi:hypothetical protein